VPQLAGVQCRSASPIVPHPSTLDGEGLKLDGILGDDPHAILSKRDLASVPTSTSFSAVCNQVRPARAAVPWPIKMPPLLPSPWFPTQTIRTGIILLNLGLMRMRSMHCISLSYLQWLVFLFGWPARQLTVSRPEQAPPPPNGAACQNSLNSMQTHNTRAVPYRPFSPSANGLERLNGCQDCDTGFLFGVLATRSAA